MKFLLDSDWMIDAAIGMPDALRGIDVTRPEGLAVSTVAMAEIFEGAYILADPEAGLAAYRRLLAECSVLDVTEPVAETFAKVRFALRKQGNLIPDMDLLIAATALAFDLTLLSRNRRHFARVRGQRLYQPA